MNSKIILSFECADATLDYILDENKEFFNKTLFTRLLSKNFNTIKINKNTYKNFIIKVPECQNIVYDYIVNQILDNTTLNLMVIFNDNRIEEILPKILTSNNINLNELNTNLHMELSKKYKKLYNEILSNKKIMYSDADKKFINSDQKNLKLSLSSFAKFDNIVELNNGIYIPTFKNRDIEENYYNNPENINKALICCHSDSVKVSTNHEYYIDNIAIVVVRRRFNDDGDEYDSCPLGSGDDMRKNEDFTSMVIIFEDDFIDQVLYADQKNNCLKKYGHINSVDNLLEDDDSEISQVITDIFNDFDKDHFSYIKYDLDESIDGIFLQYVT